jgi:dTDP-4-amino-4,6-dideoxygalactose transaminase
MRRNEWLRFQARFMGISLLRPSLPSASALMPYLTRIDERRFYSNFGPLTQELESRIGQRLGLSARSVTTAANATVGLTAALLAQNPARNSLCLMPAWTFVATPLAALAAGLRPYFLDVDPDHWALSPEACEAMLDTEMGPVGAVVPVAPFGRPVDAAAWDLFRARTGVAVVIDAAAAFDATLAGDVPHVVSLHATKALGCGEGGYVACRDVDLAQRTRAWLGFGFHGSRDAAVPGFNGKMSEYHAAVALAALDAWPETRAALMDRSRRYLDAFAGSNLVRPQPGFGATWVAATCVVELPDGATERVEARLQVAGTDTRRWWGDGAHRHTATASMSRGLLPVTERLARSTLGLPFYADIPTAEIARVADQVLTALEA